MSRSEMQSGGKWKHTEQKKEHMIQSKQTVGKLKARTQIFDTSNLISYVCIFNAQFNLQ